MAEKKDVDALINEADEILNGCKNNSIRDIFPKEIKVSGKSIKREENYEPELLDSVKYVIFDNLLKEPKNPLNIKIQPGEKEQIKKDLKSKALQQSIDEGILVRAKNHSIELLSGMIAEIIGNDYEVEIQ